MKKILALVLALVMTLSLATISSGAAFSDADSVQYTDAVNTLNALGVLGGYGDGTIRPAADVTRGAAAKMVAMVATGSNATTIGYYKGTSSFADVPATHTFADAVAFCVARGIVAGYGDGNYGVADNVKGWAVAKMVLVAMGYDAKAYGMEGAGSALNTITLATQVGLFAGMKADFVATEAASREECAQIVYNALTKEGMVSTPANSDGVVTFKGSNKCLLNNYGVAVTLDKETAMEALAAKNIGVVTANQATGETYTVIGSDSYAVETGLDLVGHKVLFVKDGSKDAYDVEGVFAVVDLSTVVNVAKATTKEEEFKAAFGFASKDAKGVTDKKVANEFADYSVVAADKKTAAVDGVKAAAGTYVLYGKEIVSYMTGSTSVGYVKDYFAGNSANDGYIKVQIGKDVVSYAIETSDESVKKNETTLVSYYADLAKGDVVLVNGTGKLTTLAKAATVSGVVSAADASKDYESITIGGTVYAQSANYTEVSSYISEAGTLLTWTGSLTKTVVAYVDANGAIFALTEKAGETSDAGLVYVVTGYEVAGAVDAYGTQAASTYYAQCVDMSGKEVTYQVNATEYDAITDTDGKGADTATKSGLMKATLAYDAGVKATCATFSADDDAAKAWLIEAGAVDTTKSPLKVEKTSHYYASDVKTIYVDGALDKLEVVVKDGAQTAASVAYYAVKNGANYDVKYILVGGAPSTTVASTDVVYVSAGSDADDKTDDVQTAKTATYTDANGQAQIANVYSIYVNGTLTEVKSLDKALKAGFNEYTIDSATGLYSFKAYKTNVDTGLEAKGLYGTKLTVGAMEDLEASAAKIVDVRYAEAWDKTGLVEITSLSGLLADGVLTSKGATVDVVYTVDAYGAPSTIVTIYVTAAPAK